MVNTSTTECATALIRHWMSRFGVPLVMSSERDSQFTSTLWNEIHRTTTYHHQSNGIIDSFHCTLKAALKARLQGPNWADKLPWILLSLKTVPKQDFVRSSAELVFGEPPTVPGPFIDTTTGDPFQSLMDKLRHLPTSSHGLSPETVPRSFRDNHFVCIRRDGHRGRLQHIYIQSSRKRVSGS